MAGIRLGRIAGIEIVMDWSLLIIFFLIAFSLAAGLFPQWHPDWGPGLRWGTSLAAAALFLLSVLIHELSHAVVGRRHGMSINRITLFIFGGMAHLEHEPREWRSELWMAIVGPITSLALGIGFLFLAGAAMGPGEMDPANPGEFFSDLGPVASLLIWLGNVNIILAIFNLVPGFPLDGGRVLRAALWGATGNLQKATLWASRGGRGFAWLLIASGFAMLFGIQVPFFGTGPGGLWLMLIGWFLHNAALMSYRQLEVRESLQGLPVSRLMQRHVETVSGDLAVDRFVDEHLMRSDQRAYPVTSGERLDGLICLDDIRKIDRNRWPELAVRELMTPADRLWTVEPGEDAAEALFTISGRNINQLPVVEGGRLEGMIRREDLMKWLTLNRQHTGSHSGDTSRNG